MNNSFQKIAYVGIYPPSAPRDKVYFDELKHRGIEVFECVSRKKGLGKYVQLFRQLKNIVRDTDMVWVGYLSVGAVIVAYLAGGGKTILYNALSSSYESYILDRQVASKLSFKAIVFWLADFLAFHLAHIVLVESESQKKFLARMFAVNPDRLHVVFTGADEEIFYPDSTIQKKSDFTAVFRGLFIPATGIEVVLEAAKLLKNEPVKFVISGWGQLLDEVSAFIRNNDLKNIELNTVFLEPEALHRLMLSGQVLLGQFSDNQRLERTIQHKTVEALALGMPFITRDSASNREILKDGVDCLFVPPADPKALAEKILYIKAHPHIGEKIAAGARITYERDLSRNKLGERLLRILKGYFDVRTK